MTDSSRADEKFPAPAKFPRFALAGRLGGLGDWDPMTFRHAAAALTLLTAALAGGDRCEAAVVTTEIADSETFAAASAPAVPAPAEQDGPAVSDSPCSQAGTSGGSPVVHAGVALPADPAAVMGGTLPAAVPLPNRCLRPLLFPGGIFRPPRCV